VEISEKTLQGTWAGGDHASESIYGLMKISKNVISWGGTNKFNPRCSTRFAIKMEPAGSTFKDIRNKVTSIDANNSEKSYLLYLDPVRCANVKKLRMTFPLKGERDYLEMIEYEDGVGEDGVTGYMHFNRE